MIAQIEDRGVQGEDRESNRRSVEEKLVEGEVDQRRRADDNIRRIPTIVAIPPTFAAKTSAITNGIGSMLRPSNTSTVNGTMKRATVTMSRSEAIPAVSNGRRTYIRTG